MFTKALILVLLGSSLVVSSPVADLGVIDKNQEWSAEWKLLDSIFDSALDTVNQLYQVNAAYAKELGKDEAAYLKQQAAEAQDSTIAKIVSILHAAGVKLLQKAGEIGNQIVGYEAEKIISEAQKKINQVLDSAKRSWYQEYPGLKPQ